MRKKQFVSSYNLYQVHHDISYTNFISVFIILLFVLLEHKDIQEKELKLHIWRQELKQRPCRNFSNWLALYGLLSFLCCSKTPPARQWHSTRQCVSFPVNYQQRKCYISLTTDQTYEDFFFSLDILSSRITTSVSTRHKEQTVKKKTTFMMFWLLLLGFTFIIN